MRERRGLRDLVVCVRCAAGLDLNEAPLRCTRCGQEYGFVGLIPMLLPRADDHLNLWRQQLTALKAQGQHTLSAIDEELETPGLLASTQARLGALSAALLARRGVRAGGARRLQDRALGHGIPNAPGITAEWPR